MGAPKPCRGYPTRTAACVALAAEGLNTSQIGARLGISASTAGALLASNKRREHGDNRKLPPRQPNRTAALEQSALDLWEEGLSFEQIAKRLGERRERIASILAYMREGDNDRAFGPKAIASQTAALLAAIRKHHPERCVG